MAKLDARSKRGKTLMDLVTEVKCDESVPFNKPLMRKRETTYLTELTFDLDDSKTLDQTTVKPVSLLSLCQEQIVQEKKESLHDTSISNSADANDCLPSAFESDQKLLTSVHSCNKLSLSKLSKLSCRTPSSSRFSDKAERSKTTLGIFHQHNARTQSSPSHGMSLLEVDSQTIAYVESPTFDSSATTPTLNTFISDIAFQHSSRGVAVLKKQFHIKTLVMNQPIKSNLPGSLMKLAQHFDCMLAKAYSQRCYHNFDFSSQSPDDLVQEKQYIVFFN